MAQIGPSNASYTCHRQESRAGFRHGNGTRKTRQNWIVGETVNVGFVKDLMIVRTPDMSVDACTSYELLSKTGARYGFEPHMGLFRL